MIGKIFPRKLNKEAEISLIKPEEMMDALNVLASGGEGNDASLVKKAHGNIEALANDSANLFQDDGGSAEDVIGQVVDESSQRVYYFTKSASSESVYLAEQVDENNIKLTLLLRDFDLGFDKHVAADIIKTPKKDIGFLSQDGTISGESGDDTNVFDFQFDNDSTTVVENQTFIIVTSPPNFLTSPLYDGSEKTFFGQLSVKNIGSEDGEVTVTTAITSGNLDNVFFQFDAGANSTVSLNLSSNQTAVIPFRAIIAEGVDPADASYEFNFLIEETPGPNNQNPISVDYDRVIGLQFIVPSYPVQIVATPTSASSGLEGDSSNIEIIESFTGVSGSPVTGLLGGIETPETSLASYLGFLTIEITIQNELEAGNFLPEMSLRVGVAGGPSGDYEGSNNGLYTDPSQIVNDQLDPFSSLSFPLEASDFTSSVDGKTATKQVYIGKKWDTNGLEGVLVTQPISISVINGDTGSPFGLSTFDSNLGESVPTDDAPFYAINYVDVEYTVANVPSPVSVISLNGQIDESISLDSRVYSATEDALVGGSSDQFSFQVKNNGESDGYFNVSIDPMTNAHRQAREIFGFEGGFEFLNGASIGRIISSWYNGMEIDYAVNNTTDGLIEQTNATKPNFVKSFIDNDTLFQTGNTFNFFEFIDGLPGQESNTGYPWHAPESEQSWIFIPAGAQATVTIRMSNLSMGVYPMFPSNNRGFGLWEYGFSPLESDGYSQLDHKTAVVFPKKNAQGIGPEFLFENYVNESAEAPLPFLTDGYDAGNFMQDASASNSNGKDNLLAAPIWKDIMSKIIIYSSPSGSFNDAASTGGGEFKVNTIESAQPELLVYAYGNYAHNSSMAILGFQGGLSPTTPILNSYFPIQYPQEDNGDFAIVPPSNNTSANANSGSTSRGNFILEIFGAGNDSPTTVSDAQNVLLNHWGRENGLPIYLGFYAASITTGGQLATIELTSSTIASFTGNLGLYSPFGPHDQTEVSIPGGQTALLSGSIGTGYCGSYSAGENAYSLQDGVARYSYNLGDAGVSMRIFEKPKIASGSSTLVQSPENAVIGYDQSLYGPTPTHGRYRRLSLNMTPGSFLTVHPSHMLSYNFYNKGQLDPTADNQSLSDTIGYTVKHIISATGFRNETFFESSNNELCVEQVHSKSGPFQYHATGVPPEGGGGPTDPDDPFGIGSSPPPEFPIEFGGERQSVGGVDDSNQPSNTTDSISLNLSSDRNREEGAKRADSLKSSGVSPNKKKRY